MKTNHLDQLRSEKAEAERKRDQAQRQANRYANQIEYVQKRSRSERTHHLCIIGGAVVAVDFLKKRFILSVEFAHIDFSFYVISPSQRRNASRGIFILFPLNVNSNPIKYGLCFAVQRIECGFACRIGAISAGYRISFVLDLISSNVIGFTPFRSHGAPSCAMAVTKIED